MLNRIALLVEYDGSAFYGFQVQEKQRTIQGEIERALSIIHKGEFIRIHPSGRTDTGVHARGQVIHFDTPLSIDPARWPQALNGCLPNDIRIVEAARVADDFHTRYDSVRKHYRYRVLNRKERDVFRRNLAFFVPYEMDLDLIRAGAAHLLGTHDFSSFCVTNADVKSKVRTLHTLEVNRQGDEIVFDLIGDGFLHNMVRIIVGTLLEVGGGRRAPEDIVRIRDARNRAAAGKTAPGHGLFLWRVFYEQPIFQHNRTSSNDNEA
ncbi:tRNA pseudouridine(38-40) synthase TruA [Alkalihalobacillus oceani]|uniref:tRNA pseudouridine(38-40) synthase TruA n=1 Tax=Halalkalibacter oceani TaxID=1653776 RepID=UPI00203B07E0|nr:tRNA pseudouridine(38-40) synthase TruA [Halalkalibacter oceani]MCM3762350.1 tRNA pseudouridine(38-40) synthase TruA [Halalkalibacter oceani]